MAAKADSHHRASKARQEPMDLIDWLAQLGVKAQPRCRYSEAPAFRLASE